MNVITATEVSTGETTKRLCCRRVYTGGGGGFRPVRHHRRRERDGEVSCDTDRVWLCDGGLRLIPIPDSDALLPLPNNLNAAIPSLPIFDNFSHPHNSNTQNIRRKKNSPPQSSVGERLQLVEERWWRTLILERHPVGRRKFEERRTC